MSEKKTRGGAGRGQGRKPAENPKVNITYRIDPALAKWISGQIEPTKTLEKAIIQIMNIPTQSELDKFLSPLKREFPNQEFVIVIFTPGDGSLPLVSGTVEVSEMLDVLKEAVERVELEA